MGYYEKIKEIQQLLWKDDDRMDQETLFELQDGVADLALAIATDEGWEKDLVASFPWLYELKDGDQ